MLSLQEELNINGNKKLKVTKKPVRRKIKTFIFRKVIRNKNDSKQEIFVVKFDLDQIKRHLSGKAKPSDKFVIVKKMSNRELIEHFGWWKRAWKSVKKTTKRVAKKVAKKATKVYKKAKTVAKKAVKAVKKVAKKALSAVQKGLNALKGVSPAQIAKLMNIFKNQQKAMQNAEKKKQLALLKAQKAKWKMEEKRDAAERRKMEAELARGKKDDSIKTPQPKFDDNDIKDIQLGSGVSSDLGNSGKFKTPKLNTKMNVILNRSSQEFGTIPKANWDGFTNIGPNSSFKICSIVILLLLVFLFYYYT